MLNTNGSVVCDFCGGCADDLPERFFVFRGTGNPEVAICSECAQIVMYIVLDKHLGFNTDRLDRNLAYENENAQGAVYARAAGLR